MSIAWKVLKFPGIAAFEDTIKKVTLKHPVLRSLYNQKKGVPLMIENKELPPLIEEVEIDGWTQKECEDFLEREPYRPFDLEQSIQRWVILSKGGSPAILSWTINHIACDIRSMFIIARDLRGGLCVGAAISEVPAAPGLYSDFIKYQDQLAASEKWKKDLAYWREKLHSEVHPAEIYNDFPREKEHFYGSKLLTQPLEVSISNSLEGVAANSGVNLMNIYLSAWFILLGQISNGTNLRVGVPSYGRPGRKKGVFQDTVGFFVNTIPFCWEADYDLSYPDFLNYLKSHFRDAMRHSGVNFVRVLENLQDKREQARNPGFDVTFGWEDLAYFEAESGPPIVVEGDNGGEIWDMGPLVLEKLQFLTVGGFDLNMRVVKNGEKLNLILDYNPRLYKESTIGQLMGAYNEILEKIVLDCSTKLSGLVSYPAQFTKKHTLNEEQDSNPKLFLDLFSKAAQQFGGLPAVAGDSESWTYDTLETRSNQLAHYLIERGIGKGKKTGLLLDNGPEATLSILGIMKTGAAYLPMSTAFPEERLKYLIKDGEVELIIADSGSVFSIPEDYNGVIVVFDQLFGVLPRYAANRPDVEIREDQLAYVLYTSGSTGKPKGVMIQHYALAHLIDARADIIPFSPGDRVLQFYALTFDTSVLMTTLTLCTGGCLYYANFNLRFGGADLGAFILENQIKTASGTPSVWSTVPEGDYPDLNYIFLVGEALPQNLAKRWGEEYGLINGYGPTEATVKSTTAFVKGAKKPSIGKPIKHVECQILNGRGIPVPVGIPGELHLGGPLLAAGYLNRPDLTEKAFIPHPLSTKRGARLYRTGDKAMWLPNGEIDYLGRVDFQLKMRGVRIEPGEIEKAAESHSEVEQAIVGKVGEGGGARLVCWLTTVEKRTGLEVELREYLRIRLPRYMVPSTFVWMEAFPLNPSGKADRRQLPAPEEKVLVIEPELNSEIKGGEEDEVDAELKTIWQRLLRTNDFSLEDDFFEVGGHSLMIHQVYSLLSNNLKPYLKVLDLYEYSSIQSLSEIIRQRRGEDKTERLEVRIIQSSATN